MWPVFAGILAGAAIGTFIGWNPIRAAIEANLSPIVVSEHWHRAARLFTLAICAAFLLSAATLLLLLLFLLRLDGFPQSSIWAFFYQTHIIGFGLGAFAGILCASWYRESKSEDAPNLIARGVFVSAATAVVILFGVNQNYNIFGGINKISTSFLSLEFDPAAKRTSARLTANVATAIEAPGSAKWTVTERIGVAISVLLELSSGVHKDRKVAEFSTVRTILYPDNDQSDIELEKVTRFLELNDIRGLVETRRAIHGSRRNANPLYFDGAGGPYESGLATGLREIVLSDLSHIPPVDSVRRSDVSKLAETFAAFKIDSLVAECILAMPDNDGSSKDSNTSGSKRANELCDKLEHVSGFRPDSPKYYSLDFFRNARSELLKYSRSGFISKLQSDFLKKFEESFPPREVVQNTPYVAIVAACLFYAAGESEAAVSLLDRWISYSNAARRKLEISWDDQGIRKRFLHRAYRIRVLNLMGTFFADDVNPIHVELGSKYQWAALEESDDFIKDRRAFDKYVTERTMRSPDKFDVVSLAKIKAGDERGECPAASIREHSVRYFLYRRWNMLNNVVFYLAKQPRLLERDKLLADYDRLIAKLRIVRVDCLARDVKCPAPLVGVDMKEDLQSPACVGPETIEDAKDLASADAMARTLDTLARALIVRGDLHRADERTTKKTYCEARDIARAAVRWTTETDEIGARMSSKVGSQPPSDPNPPQSGFARRQFVEAGLSANGERIVRRQPIDDAEAVLRHAEERLERLGLGACADHSP